MKVLYFGAVADAVGMRSQAIGLPAGTTGRAAFDEIVGRHKSLAGRRLLFSINQKYSDGSELVSDGDELAVFTAVSGG